jgi:hypothetical protein
MIAKPPPPPKKKKKRKKEKKRKKSLTVIVGGLKYIENMETLRKMYQFEERKFLCPSVSKTKYFFKGNSLSKSKENTPPCF